MHPCLRVLLLLVINFPHLQAAPSAPGRTASTRRVGCHKFVPLKHDFILFRTDSQPDFNFDFAIETHYYPYYPKVLRMALQLNRFVPDTYSIQPQCGWHKARSVSSLSLGEVGRHRGDIYWKYSDLGWVEYPKNSTKVSHWVAASPDHIPPRTGALPGNDTLNQIAAILQGNEPAADVYQLATVLLSYFCGFLGFVLILICIHRCISRRSGSADGESSDAIELGQVTMDSTAKFTTTQSTMPAADDQEAPLENPFMSEHDSTRGTGNAESTDPPPLYSVDGAGR
ncbi:hypothetical protein FB567DRAFT_548663 [Paraphoma chrysanthemicola]|uniref:Uncharacterized protein n=1 Tax=Paraphoma chrysanthemicola TaxID=798071 RepID=A0A8K0R6N0_9PLEO|nr:hypothetical protein FB567DRAFT_548663 [Paraphoma chrysanthemicola]